jgi:hypothetical protein
MTERFDAFKAALHALCVEHDVNLHGEWVDYEDFRVQVEPASERMQAGCDLEIECVIPPTPEEIAAEEARRAAEKAELEAYEAERQAAYFARYGHLIGKGDLPALSAAIEAERQEQRKKNMRVTRILGDHHDIGDRPCSVYLNNVPVEDWTVADDFRRVVETPDGARFGSVRIDMQPQTAEPAEEAATHLCGMFVVGPKPEAPAIEIVEAEREPIQPTIVIAKPQPTGRRKGRK